MPLEEYTQHVEAQPALILTAAPARTAFNLCTALIRLCNLTICSPNLSSAGAHEDVVLSEPTLGFSSRQHRCRWSVAGVRGHGHRHPDTRHPAEIEHQCHMNLQVPRKFFVWHELQFDLVNGLARVPAFTIAGANGVSLHHRAHMHARLQEPRPTCALAQPHAPDLGLPAVDRIHAQRSCTSSDP